MKKHWQTLKSLTARYTKLNLHDSLDYDKFYLYSLIAHSTQIEGSTLTIDDTQKLFDNGLTANGKPYEFHTMNISLKGAYEYAIEQAKKKTPVTPGFLKSLASLVMKDIGTEYNNIQGSWDEKKGDFRKHSVTAGVGGRSYEKWQKIPNLIDDLCSGITSEMKNASTIEDKYMLSFNAMLSLVTIHPWSDGNGRASRLLMNYIQFYFGLVPTKIHSGDKRRFIDSLKKAQVENDPEPFRRFMIVQHNKTLREEIKRAEKNDNKGTSPIFI